jgi:predicted nucleic acid-binding protein
MHRGAAQSEPAQGLFAVVKGIADTGFLVAAANRADRYHDWAASVAAKITEPLLTCESVLSEAAFHLGSVQIVVGMVKDGMVTVAFDVNEHLPHLLELAKRYADRAPDFADLCLVRMSELHPGHPVVTVDGDFRVYRRNKREVIPLICPPGV